MRFQAMEPHGPYRGPVRETFGLAETDAAIQRSLAAWASVRVLAICPNCEQWRHGGDCFHECANRGLAPKAGPETLNT